MPSSQRHQPAHNVVYWRCTACRHILGEVRDGVCVIMHTIRLGDGAPVVVCPVCGTEVKWYSYRREEE